MGGSWFIPPPKKGQSVGSAVVSPKRVPPGSQSLKSRRLPKKPGQEYDEIRRGHELSIPGCPPSRRVQNQPLAQRPQSSVNPINLSGMFQVRKPVHFLFRCSNSPRQLYGPNLLPQHFIQKKNLCRDAGPKFNRVLTAFRFRWGWDRTARVEVET